MKNAVLGLVSGLVAFALVLISGGSVLLAFATYVVIGAAGTLLTALIGVGCEKFATAVSGASLAQPFRMTDSASGPFSGTIPILSRDREAPGAWRPKGRNVPDHTE